MRKFIPYITATIILSLTVLAYTLGSPSVSSASSQFYPNGVYHTTIVSIQHNDYNFANGISIETNRPCGYQINDPVNYTLSAPAKYSMIVLLNPPNSCSVTATVFPDATII